MTAVNTAVIGAGVVGLAVARALAQAGREVLIVERHAAIGTETSSRNSEVIHSGVYYTPGSLKARLCVEGRKRLYDYCGRRTIPHRCTGKLVVATAESEIAALEDYAKRGSLNGIGPTAWLDADEARRLEPEVSCIRALEIGQTGIVDSHAFMTSLWGDLLDSGGDVAFRCGIRGGCRLDDGRFSLDVDGEADPLICRILVNAAGLHAPAVARSLAACGGEQAPTAYFARGHYFTLTGPSPFSRLIYPLADATGLGIHVTIDLGGGARFGPDAEWVDAPDYSFDESRREKFAAAIRRYFPRLDANRLRPGYVGIRPKIAAPGQPAADFRIDGPDQHGVKGLVHLYGIESPGLTASLAIGESVTQMLQS